MPDMLEITCLEEVHTIAMVGLVVVRKKKMVDLVEDRSLSLVYNKIVNKIVPI